MEELFRKAPKTLLALVAIVLGFGLIIGFNPPRTICDEQLDVFRESQKVFLNASGKKVSKSIATETFELCKSDNGPGGCFDFFQNMRGMVDGLERIPKNCAATVAGDGMVKGWLFKTMTLMTQIAWGDSTKGVYVSKKLGWMDASDFRLFCRAKTLATRFYGEEGIQTLRESVLATLPGADKMSREQKWSRSIFSSPCDEAKIISISAIVGVERASFAT